MSNSSPAEVPTRRGRRRWIALAVALLLFVGLRAAWCWLQPSELYFSEEYIQLRLAALVWGEDEAWEGLLDEPPSQGLDPERPFDLFDFQYHPHEGGTLVVSLLLVPIVGVTGLGELPVKLLSILLGLATAIAWVGLLRRLHGEEATIPTAWVFACAVIGFRPKRNESIPRTAVVLAALVMTGAYLIPHSMGGSELNYEAVEQGIDPADAIRTGKQE